MAVLLSEAYGTQPTPSPPSSNTQPNRIRSSKRKNYTMIEGFDLADSYTDIKNMGPGTVGAQDYNSNDAVTIESKKNKPPSYPPQNYMANNSLSNFPPQYVDTFKKEQMRDVSFQNQEMKYSSNFYPVSTDESGGSPYPAGKVPYMNDASGMRDSNVVMGGHVKEGFHNQMYGYYPMMRGHGGCMDAVNHVMSCPMCSRYFKCDTRIYNIIIFMLILIFTIIIYFLYREERR